MALRRESASGRNRFLCTLLKDTQNFLDTHLQSQTFGKDDANVAKDLSDRCVRILRALDTRSVDGRNGQSDEQEIEDDNSSYLEMSMRKYESYDMSKTRDLQPNDYVDVNEKLAKKSIASYSLDDDNIYDNYVVERKSGHSKMVPATTTSKLEAKQRTVNITRDCPFSGLPGTHLAIKKSRKTGFLTLRQRRRRLFHLLPYYFSKRFYVGLMCNTDENEFVDWWLLMYAGDVSDLKPTLCLQLSQYEVYRTTKRERPSRFRRNSSGEAKKSTAELSFELRQKDHGNKTSQSDAIIYRLTASSADECQQWYSILTQLLNDPRDVGRELPNLPFGSKFSKADEIDANCNSALNDRLLYTNHDLLNYSEGVYEEPEECYKNVPLKTESLLSSEDPILTYDVPKSSARALQPPLQSETCQRSSIVTVTETLNDTSSDCASDVRPIEMNSVKISEIRSKLSSQLKDHKLKLSTVDDISNVDTQSATVNAKDDQHRNSHKVNLNAVRKWLFVSHLMRFRHATNTPQKSTNSIEGSERMSIVAPKEIGGKEKSIYTTPPKGNKVHMIINQLEANGQLTLLSSAGGALVGSTKS